MAAGPAHVTALCATAMVRRAVLTCSSQQHDCAAVLRSCITQLYYTDGSHLNLALAPLLHGCLQRRPPIPEGAGQASRETQGSRHGRARRAGQALTDSFMPAAALLSHRCSKAPRRRICAATQAKEAAPNRTLAAGPPGSRAAAAGPSAAAAPARTAATAGEAQGQGRAGRVGGGAPGRRARRSVLAAQSALRALQVCL